jgi:hypothetical protein
MLESVSLILKKLTVYACKYYT